MPTATDRSKTDCTHRKIVKNNLIGKKKKLQEENDKIDRILRSSAYTEAEKERNFHQRERNLKEIIKLNDEINKIDNELFSPTGNNPVSRGRSQTRGPNIRNVSPSPIKRPPRSASSSVPRRRINQTNEDELRTIQDQLEQWSKENELLRRELAEERHKVQETASKLQGEYEVIIFDLNLEISSLIEELKEKEAALTKLENVDIPHLQQERDEYKDSAAQIKQKLRQEMNIQLKESEIISRQKVAEVEEILQAYKVENEKLRNENSETMEQYQSLRIFFSQRRDYYNEVAEKAEENTAILHERLKTEVEEKERIQRDNITLKTQIDSTSRGHEKNRKNTLEKLGKLQNENDRLKEKLELIQNAYQRECGNVTTLQQKETEMRQKISEIKRRNQYLENEMKEEKYSVSTKREHEIEIIRLHSVVRDKDLVEVKLRNEIEDLEKKINEIQSRTDKWLRDIQENDRRSKQLKEENDKELNRLRQLEIDYKSEAEVLRSNQTDLENKVQHLQAEKERLQLNGETERQAAEELRRVLYAEKRNSNELRDRIKDLERFKEQEIHYKSETEILRSNHTDLEKKVQNLQTETKRLQRNGEMERKVAEELRFELDSEKGKSNELRDRIKDLERLLRIEEKGREQLKQDSDKELKRLRQLEINYKIGKEALRSNHTDLEKKVKQLQDEKERLLQNEQSERKLAEKLKRELDAEKRDSNKIRDRMRYLERESFQSIEKLETGRKQILDEKDRELMRLRRLENDYKNKTDILKHELVDLRKDFVLLQEEKDQLIHSKKTEMKKAKDVQKELDDARREEAKFLNKIKELEKYMMTVTKVDPSMSEENSRLKEDQKHIGIELQNAQKRLRRLHSVYKNETDTLKHELADLTKKIELLQEENEELVESEETERKIAETLQNELDDAKRETLMLQDRIKELQRQMNTFPKVDPSMATENSGLKEHLKHLGTELQKAQQKIEENDENVCHYMRQVEALQRENQQTVAEKEIALTRIRRLERNYKKDTEDLKSSKDDLEKNIEYLQSEKERHRRDEEAKRKSAEKLRSELDSAKGNSNELRDRIKNLEQVLNIKERRKEQLEKEHDEELLSYKKKEESLVENVNRLRKENDGLVQNGNREREEAEKLKRELYATKTDLKKLQDRIRDLERKGATFVDKKDESDSLTLTLSEAVKEFQGICKKEWKEAAPTVSDDHVVESQIWQKLYEILKKKLEMISTGNHHVPYSATDAVKTSLSKNGEHEKYSDIEGSVIRIVDNQDTESGNPSASVGTSPIGMACSVTNYDLTSDFSKSCSIKAQKE